MTKHKLNLTLVLIFFFYMAVRFISNLSSIDNPRELADTVSYLRISREPLGTADFWGNSRPFVFPLLLKITRQDISWASVLQVAFSILSWGGLAYSVSTSLQTSWLKLLSFSILLALSLLRRFAGWDYVMMTESLSVSLLAMFIALSIWLFQEWKPYKVVLFLVVAFFLAFARDTNAYLLLMLVGLLLIAYLFHWLKPRILILVTVFCLIFLLSNYTSELGARWVFPFNNLVGRRVLPFLQAREYFESCGMPITPELLSLTNEYANGQNRAFYNDPALDDYRVWMEDRGRHCYIKWLFSNPIRSFGSVFGQFENLIRFEKMDEFFARRYDPLIPYFIEPFLYPVQGIIFFWVILTFIAFIALWTQKWRANSLWSVYILLCLTIIPHLFVAWHGDAMATERHALSVGVQFVLSYWILIFLLADEYLTQKRPAKYG